MLHRLLAGLLATSPLEAAAVILGILYSLLAVRLRRSCWIAGGLSSLLFVYLAWSAALPMQASLQAWYVAMAVYGWLQWSRAGAVPQIGTWPLRRHCIAIAVIFLAALPASHWLATETHAAWPYLDSLSTLASLLATWLIARSKIENWLYWIAIDALLAFLFAAQGLVFSALLFAFYLGVALWGYRSWRRRQRVAGR
jgi:nicotinamide mononucleotide transporter